MGAPGNAQDGKVTIIWPFRVLLPWQTSQGTIKTDDTKSISCNHWGLAFNIPPLCLIKQRNEKPYHRSAYHLRSENFI